MCSPVLLEYIMKWWRARFRSPRRNGLAFRDQSEIYVQAETRQEAKDFMRIKLYELHGPDEPWEERNHTAYGPYHLMNPVPWPENRVPVIVRTY